MRTSIALSTSFLAVLAGLACASPPRTSAAPPDGSPPSATVERSSLKEPGVYTVGRWQYRFTVIAPGSKSEGYRGELFFDGKRVDEGRVGDYYRTPWGDMAWRGDPATLWGEHGWMPRDAGTTGGQALVEPWRTHGGPVVMAMILAPGAPPAEAPPVQVDPWVHTEMRRFGHKHFQVARAWFPLTDQAIVLHDTKMIGRLTARLALAREDAILSVLLGGSEPARVDLVRLDGTTMLMKHTLAGGLEPYDFYLAFRVDRAALGRRPPFEVGMKSNGQVVKLHGVDELVIVLPGDEDSGNVWMVASVAGDSPRGTSVEALGEPQFVPDFTRGAHPHIGHFENIFRVRGPGRTEVVLEYRRPWQQGVPPEQTFRVSLEVVEMPALAPMRSPDGAK